MSTVAPTVDNVEELVALQEWKNTVNGVQMSLWCRWALAEISYHTADTAEANFQGDGQTKAFSIDDEVIDSLDRTALVLISEGVGRTNVLPPFKFQEDTIIDTNKNNKYFWEWPTNTVNLGFVPSVSQKLTISYYRGWEAPVADTDILTIPRWMEAPLGYLIVRSFSEAYALEYSKIRQWNVKTDSGTPLQNPMFAQITHLQKQAELLLAKQPVQDRNKFFTFAGRENNGR